MSALLAGLLAMQGVPGHAVFGLGNRSCGEWTRDRLVGGAGEIAKLSWLGGYLSGQNAVLSSGAGISNILEGSDINGAAAWIDSYCGERPLDTLSQAALALSTELLERRPRKM